MALTALGRPGLPGFVTGDAELVRVCLLGKLLNLAALVLFVTVGTALETLLVLLVGKGYVSGIWSRQHLDIFGLSGGSDEECKDEGSKYVFHQYAPLRYIH